MKKKKKKIQLLFLKISLIFLNFIYVFIKMFPIQNKITFISRESDNLTMDFLLLKEKLEKDLSDYKLVFLTKKIKPGLYNKIAYVFHMLIQMYNIATSKVVITDTYCISISVLKHKKSVKFIQTWHALGLLKKAGFSILDKIEGSDSSLSNVMKMHKNYDLILSSSKECIPYLCEVFNYDKSYFRVAPLPRLDMIKSDDFVKQNRIEILGKYNILSNKKNILYAPTFRSDETELKNKIKELIKKLDYNKYNLVIKLHPLSDIGFLNNNSNPQVICDDSFSTLEMLSIADYVISDYSSIIYEAGIMQKRLYFYAFDKKEYMKNRSFFINYDKDLPQINYENIDELLKSLETEKYDFKKNKQFINRYILMDGNATERIINIIKELL